MAVAYQSAGQNVGVLFASIHQEGFRPNSSCLLHILYWRSLHSVEYVFLAKRTTEVGIANNRLSVSASTL
jgi:hypothetical protein